MPLSKLGLALGAALGGRGTSRNQLAPEPPPSPATSSVTAGGSAFTAAGSRDASTGTSVVGIAPASVSSALTLIGDASTGRASSAGEIMVCVASAGGVATACGDPPSSPAEALFSLAGASADGVAAAGATNAGRSPPASAPASAVKGAAFAPSPLDIAGPGSGVSPPLDIAARVTLGLPTSFLTGGGRFFDVSGVGVLCFVGVGVLVFATLKSFSPLCSGGGAVPSSRASFCASDSKATPSSISLPPRPVTSVLLLLMLKRRYRFFAADIAFFARFCSRVPACWNRKMSLKSYRGIASSSAGCPSTSDICSML
mmetsp:Transcript_95019/g.271686  ORF Transcript_95019/g.271686 Transcript_95019/m.271686 type:complete len:313 (+) Transcript_95019:126-1064(+)